MLIYHERDSIRRQSETDNLRLEPLKLRPRYDRGTALAWVRISLGMHVEAVEQL